MSQPNVVVNVEGKHSNGLGCYGTVVLEGFPEVIKWKETVYHNPTQVSKAIAKAEVTPTPSLDMEDLVGDVITYVQVRTNPTVNKAVRQAILEPISTASADYFRKSRFGLFE